MLSLAMHYAIAAALIALAVLVIGFGYQMTFGNGSRLKNEDRRWWRFDWIWPPLE